MARKYWCTVIIQGKLQPPSVGYNIWTNCQRFTLVPPLNSGANSAPTSVQVLVLAMVGTSYRVFDSMSLTWEIMELPLKLKNCFLILIKRLSHRKWCFNFLLIRPSGLDELMPSCAGVVCHHNSQEMLLLPQFLSYFNFVLVCLKESVPVYNTSSRISEIIINN